MNSAQSAIRKPLVSHLAELRARLGWIVLVVAAGSVGAFSIHQQLLEIIQRPLDQTLYFTSPTGGFTFVFQLCLTVGIVLGFPVIIYHVYQFLVPLFVKHKKIILVSYTIASFVMACLGALFAYFISLPAALHFLTQFGGENIESLIKADEYFAFALAYVGGFAILFQIPLVVLFINKITPLKPSGMFRAQRWVVLGSFIVAAIITPTPDPLNQALMAAPAIVLYQISIVLVFVVNWRRPRSVRPKASIGAEKIMAPAFDHTAPRPQPEKRLVSDFIVTGKRNPPMDSPIGQRTSLNRSEPPINF
jgi:sec-independent protein translocase protein TatC